MYKFLRGNKPLFLLAKCPEVWLFGLYGKYMHAFFRGAGFQRDCIGLHCPAMCEWSSLSPALPTFGVNHVFHFSHFGQYSWLSHCSLIHICLMTNDVEYLLMDYLPPIYSLQWDCFAHFLIKVFVFLMLSFESSIYIPDSRSSSDMWFANIFSQSIMSFHSLNSVFCRANILKILIRSNLFFFLWVILLISSLRTLCWILSL